MKAGPAQQLQDQALHIEKYLGPCYFCFPLLILETLSVEDCV